MSITETHIFFIGAGGIGMSALARYLNARGKIVAGYDKEKTELTEKLNSEGISIQYNDDPEQVPQEFKDPGVLVVYTPAVKRAENRLLDYYFRSGNRVVKRAELLATISNSARSIAIAGTHGKTTTSALLAHIMVENGLRVTAFLGGIVRGYESNLIDRGDEYVVVEADEYDRSFLHLYPERAVVTSMDADHLDIYGTEEELHRAFVRFSSQVSGTLIYRSDLPLSGTDFAVEAPAAYSAQNIRVAGGTYTADFHTPAGVVHGVQIPLPGRHNVANALAAFALCSSLGMEPGDIAGAMRTFGGIYRRFNVYEGKNGKVIIDDYAHHPSELSALYGTVRELYPDEQLLIVFQPHTYTRTRDYWDGFVETLSKFDVPVLLPVYAAREHPLEGINSPHLAEGISKRNPQAVFVTKEHLFPLLERAEQRVILMVGAGDIGQLVPEIIRKNKEK